MFSGTAVRCEKTITEALQYLPIGASKKTVSNLGVPARFSHSRNETGRAFRTGSFDHSAAFLGAAIHDESKNRQYSPPWFRNCRLTSETGVGKLSPIIKPLCQSDFSTDSLSALTIALINAAAWSLNGSASLGRQGLFCAQHAVAANMNAENSSGVRRRRISRRYHHPSLDVMWG
jgi:hypothetical protein